MIFSKIFSSVWFARKNYEMRKCNCCRNQAVSSRCCRILASMFGRIRSDPAGFWQWPDSWQFWLDSGAGRIPVAGCCRIQAQPGFWRSTIAEFEQPNIKRACKDKEFNFQKLKKLLQSNRKWFSLTIIFAPTKHRKMPKSFSRNYFTPKQMKHKTRKARGKSTIHSYVIRISDFLVQCMEYKLGQKRKWRKKK